MGMNHEFGPHLFSMDAIDPETATFVEQLEATLVGAPPDWGRDPAILREEAEAGWASWGRLEASERMVERAIPGRSGEVRVRVCVPDAPQGVYLYLHGGGWTLGRAHHTDPHCWRIADRCRMATVSVDYRLAPEHPYPSAPDDCEAVALWLASHAVAEFGTDRIVIGGQSAGAHLSAVTLLRMRDHHGFAEFAGANLMCGAYDLTMTPSLRRWGERRLVVNTPAVAWCIDQFVDEERRTDPDVSPLYADLHHMPPAHFLVGTLDPLIDDTLFMYARWIAAGNRASIAIYPGGVHGFQMTPTSLAQRAYEGIEAFIAARTLVGNSPT